MISQRDITILDNSRGVIVLIAMNGDTVMQRRYVGRTLREAKALMVAESIDN